MVATMSSNRDVTQQEIQGLIRDVMRLDLFLENLPCRPLSDTGSLSTECMDHVNTLARVVRVLSNRPGGGVDIVDRGVDCEIGDNEGRVVIRLKELKRSHGLKLVDNEDGYCFGDRVKAPSNKRSFRGGRKLGYVIGTTAKFCDIALEPIEGGECQVVRKKNNKLERVV